jgi:hypothetical protein
VVWRVNRDSRSCSLTDGVRKGGGGLVEVHGVVDDRGWVQRMVDGSSKEGPVSMLIIV